MKQQVRTAVLAAVLVGMARGQTVVNAASLEQGVVAPDSLAAIFGERLAAATATAGAPPWPVELGGVSVTVADSAGAQLRAPLLHVSPRQINLLIPSAAAGPATISIRGAETQTVRIEIRATAPGIFAANGGGRGPAAAVALRVAANGDRTTALVADPVDLGGTGDETYLSLFGTGLRRAASLTASIGGMAVPVLGYSAQAETPGLDQVNAGPVPRGLAGRGDVDIVVTAAGARANIVTAAFRVGGLEPAVGAWGRRAPLIEANSEMGVVELNGKIYVIGGYPASRVSVATVQVYDIASDTWTRTAPLPVALNHLMPAAFDGKIYVIGGQTDANTAYVNTVHEYDPAAGRWSRKADMPTSRSAGAAVPVGGKIYVAGGRPPRGADFAAYDPAADRWETLPNLPTQRNHLIALENDGKLYVVGGRFEGGFTSPQTDAVESYDPATGRWSTRATMLKPRGGVNGVVANGCVHIFGGEGSAADPGGVYPDHDLYDPVSDKWSRVGSMPVPVHGVTGAAFVNGLIYLPGGGTSSGGSSGGVQHQVYRPGQSCR